MFSEHYATHSAYLNCRRDSTKMSEYIIKHNISCMYSESSYDIAASIESFARGCVDYTYLSVARDLAYIHIRVIARCFRELLRVSECNQLQDGDVQFCAML